MIIEQLAHKNLKIDFWEMPDDGFCTLIGNNASGKSTLANIIAGLERPEQGKLRDAPLLTRIVSLESQQELYEEELKNDDTDFMDRIDHGSTGLELLTQVTDNQEAINETAQTLGIEDLLPQHYRLYSSGEARKILLLKEILAQPELLILDEPYEGLDSQSRSELVEFIHKLTKQGQSILLFVNRLEDIPKWNTPLVILFNGSIILEGSSIELLKQKELKSLFHFDANATPTLPASPNHTEAKFENIVSLKNGRVVYGDIIQFSNLDWELNQGEHTIISGPNGAGKSTLLQLITGDHPQCYSNDLKVFGYQRGSGESIWDIKKHIGIVSASLHRDYRAGGNVLTTVISGLYDSIGLYQTPSAHDKALALEWLEILGMADEANSYFKQLSWGQQRLVLIARGLIKQPPLLILDEPTQGLDDLNSQLVLAFIERLAGLSNTTILFVSHRQDEHLSLFKHRVEFKPAVEGNTRFAAQKS